jgi:hypothetical protein
MSHARWKTLRERKLAEGYTEPDDITEARREIQLSMALAKAVYDRRTELGLTQTDLAKLADALDATLNIALDSEDTRVNFTSHHTDAA